MNLIHAWSELALAGFIPVTAFWLLCLAVALALRGRWPVFSYWLALLSLLRPFLPLSWQLPVREVPLGASLASLPEVVVSASPRPGSGFLPLLFSLWLGIALALLALYLLRLGALSRRAKGFVRRSSAVLEEIAFRLGLRRIPALFSHSGIRVPFTWGISRPAIAVSEEIIGWEEPRRAPVLAHEAAHIARGDNLALLIENLVTIAFFFNPALWLLRRFLSVQREILADRTALSLTGNDPVAYGRTLLSNAELCLAGRGISNHFAHSRLKARIQRLVRLKEVTMPAFGTYQKLTLIVLLAGLFLLSAGRISPVSASPAEGAKTPKTLRLALELPPQIKLDPSGVQPPQADAKDLAGLPAAELIQKYGKNEPLIVKEDDKLYLTYLQDGDKEPRILLEEGKDDGESDLDLKNPKVLYRVNPSYPQDMRKEGWMAEVILLISVEPQGTVEKVRSAVTTMTKEEKGDKLVRVSELKDNPFAKAAIDAVLQWRFEPVENAMQLRIPVVFKLQ
jgi:TonB family protein